MIDNLLVAVHTFASLILMSFSVDETLLQMCVNLSTNFREPQFREDMSPFSLKHMYSVLFAFTWRLMPPAACSILYCRDLTWVGVFVRSAISSALSVSVIFSVGYRPRLVFFNGKNKYEWFNSLKWLWFIFNWFCMIGISQVNLKSYDCVRIIFIGSLKCSNRQSIEFWLYSLQNGKTLEKRCPRYNTKPRQILRIWFWKSKECKVPLYCYYSQVHSDPDW